MLALRYRIDRIVEGDGVFPGVDKATRTFDVHATLVDSKGLALRDGEFRVRLTPEELKATGWSGDSIVRVPVEDEEPAEAVKVLAALAAARP